MQKQESHIFDLPCLADLGIGTVNLAYEINTVFSMTGIEKKPSFYLTDPVRAWEEVAMSLFVNS